MLLYGQIMQQQSSNQIAEDHIDKDWTRLLSLALVGRGGRVGRAQVSKSRGPGFNPTDAVSNLGQVRLPHVALV